MVDDGSLDYFKAHGFTAVHLVVPGSGTYQTELNKIKSLGMKPIIDVEVVIWNAGQLQSTPITSFGPYFQSLKNAGWEYVSSEGGRACDLAYTKIHNFICSLDNIPKSNNSNDVIINTQVLEHIPEP